MLGMRIRLIFQASKASTRRAYSDVTAENRGSATRYEHFSSLVCNMKIVVDIFDCDFYVFSISSTLF